MIAAATPATAVRIPAPVWPVELPDLDAMTDAEREAWVVAEALAMVRDTGYVGIEADRLLHRGWPLEAIDWRLATFPAATPERRRAFELAQRLALDPVDFGIATGRTGLGLVGAPGRGKTGLACAIGAALDAAGCDVRFARWGGVMADAYAALGARRELRPANTGPSFGSEPTRRLEDVTRRLADVEVLILDDLGEEDAGSAPDFARRVLREIVWPRYERRATTIVTTNLGPAEMEAQFGEAATSRLAGLLHWLVLDGPDERRAR